MRNILITSIVAILAGCATTANYENILKTWIGSSADNLVSSWGPPQSVYNLSNGGKLLEYSNSRNVQLGGYTYTTPQTTYDSGTFNTYGTYSSTYGNYSGTSTTYVQKTTPTYNVTKSCKTRFTVNKSDIVTKWTWHGNDCKALPPK